MGIASNEAKQHWNSAHYTQVKVSVKSEIAAAFKADCLAQGVSMAGEITRFMVEKIDSGVDCHRQSSKSSHPVAVSSRPQRRKAAKYILELLESMIDSETQYIENIPQNLRNSSNYEAAQQSLSDLEEAAELLRNAY